MDIFIVITTCETTAAPRMVEALLEKRLIACGNIVPHVLSIYR